MEISLCMQEHVHRIQTHTYYMLQFYIHVYTCTCICMKNHLFGLGSRNGLRDVHSFLCLDSGVIIP